MIGSCGPRCVSVLSFDEQLASINNDEPIDSTARYLPNFIKLQTRMPFILYRRLPVRACRQYVGLAV